MALQLPAGHTPRYENFEIAGVSDEMIGEGLESALFGATDDRKLQLVEALSDAGTCDIHMGSGISERKFLLRCLDAQQYFGRDFLDNKRSVRYFLNPVGLFPDTIEQILINAGFPQEQLTDPGFFQAIIDRLNDKLQNHLYPQKEAQYAKVMQAIHDLQSDVVRLDEVQDVAMELLQERVEVKA